MRVLVFGASGVQGYWDSEGGWVQRLKKHYDLMKVKDLSLDNPRVMNLGVAGETSKDLLARVEPETKARQYPKGLALVFSIGTNNAGIMDGQDNSTPEKYAQEVEALIEIARKYTDKIIFLGLHPVNEKLTSPVAWTDLVFKNENIWKYEQILREVCEQQSVTQVKIFETITQRVDGGQELICGDGVHLNDEGHQLVCDMLRPELDSLLKKN